MNPDSRHPLLLIEDDPEIVRSVSELVKTEIGLPFETSSDGLEGLKVAMEKDFGLIIIDINLPSMSGFEVCRAIRQHRPSQAILLLSARGEEIDKVLGLELGADDYVTKPFSSRELAARIKAVLRRAQRTQELTASTPKLEYPGLTIDMVSRRVWLDGALVELTYVEFEILSLLAAQPGTTFSRADLLEMALGYTTGVHDDTLTVHLSKLRAKLEKDARNPTYIRTVRGVGYRFAAPDELPKR